MQLVEIKPSEINVAIDLKSTIEGAIIEFKPQECGNIQCGRFDVCVPHIIRNNEKCKIVSVIEKFSCPNSGKPLVAVSVLPQMVF